MKKALYNNILNLYNKTVVYGCNVFRCTKSRIRSPGSQRHFSSKSGVWYKLAINYQNRPSDTVTALSVVTKTTIFDTRHVKRANGVM